MCIRDSDKFAGDAIFNWTYADEQAAKRNWQGAPGQQNPYANLPMLNLYTYQTVSYTHLGD